MSDSKVRRLRRRDRGDGVSETRLISESLRSGIIPQINVQLAAHLGHEPSKMVVGDVPYQISCDCGLKRNYCYTCKGSGQIGVETGLVASVNMVAPTGIPVKLIARWSKGCVSRALDDCAAYEGLRVRVLEPVEEWIRTGQVTPGLVGLQRDSRQMIGNTDFYVAACSELVAGTGEIIEGCAVSRFCHAVSFAYHATGHKKSERDWQTGYLIRLLLKLEPADLPL